MKAVTTLICAAAAATLSIAALAMPLERRADAIAEKIEPHLIEWRRHLHENPELSNRETQTAKYVAKALKKMGLEVQTGVAHTGVVAVLRGGKPGPVVALRADMDALPVVEEVDLPYKSVVRTSFDGKDVGVMHACGHDVHMAVLLGTAEALSIMKADLPGTIKFIFQPAEEGAPLGEEGGAELMVKEGVLSTDPQPEVIFGMHLFSQWDVGQIGYRKGSVMASSDDLSITVHGRQTHGARPWAGVDPIVVSSQIILGLQTIASRQMESTKAPVIVTIGKIEGGVRGNIIPDEVKLTGTLRALDTDMRQDLHARVRRTAQGIAESAGATATVEIAAGHSYPVTSNDPALTEQMLPTLRRVAGDAQVIEVPPMLGAEDFSFYAREIPGLFVFLGARTPGGDPEDWPANHSPRFHVDENVLSFGVRVMTNLVLDYGQSGAASHTPSNTP